MEKNQGRYSEVMHHSLATGFHISTKRVFETSWTSLRYFAYSFSIFIWPDSNNCITIEAVWVASKFIRFQGKFLI